MCLFCLIHTVLYAAPLDGGLCKRLCKVEGFARIIKVRKRENISLLKLLLELPPQQGRPGLQWPTLAVALLPMFVGGRCWGCSPWLQHYIGAAGSESRPSPSLLPAYRCQPRPREPERLPAICHCSPSSTERDRDSSVRYRHHVRVPERLWWYWPILNEAFVRINLQYQSPQGHCQDQNIKLEPEC